MNRTTGTSILVFGIVLGVIGAIMYWAVTASTDGFDINAIAVEALPFNTLRQDKHVFPGRGDAHSAFRR